MTRRSRPGRAGGRRDITRGTPAPQAQASTPPKPQRATAAEAIPAAGAGANGVLTPVGAPLRFRHMLRRARGFDVIFWPDGSRGRVEEVVVAPYAFWAEALVASRDGARLRLPVAEVRQIDSARRLLLASLPAPPHRIESTPALRAAAFFDLDRTLQARSSTLALGVLRRRGSHRRVGRTRLRRFLGSPRHGGAGTRQLVVDQLAAAKGLRPDELTALLAERSDSAPQLLDLQPLELATRHRARGEAVYLVSADVQELADVLAERLGLDAALGTTAELDASGVFTGKPRRILVGAAKADAMRELATRDHLDLSASAAYSDSSDLALLEAVGHPVALDPDRRLRRAALAHGWPVLELDLP